jgi:hypothetical protein
MAALASRRPRNLLRSISTTSTLKFPAEKQESHSPDTYNKSSTAHSETPSPSTKTHVVSDTEKVQHAHDDPNETVSGERPYQPSQGHQEGKDLRYGGASKYDGGPERDTASEREGPQGESARGRK